MKTQELTHGSYGSVSGLARAALRDRFARYVVVVGSHSDWRVNLPIQPRSFSHIPNIVDDAFFTIHRRAKSRVVLFAGASVPSKAGQYWLQLGLQ
jgi:hypothetical protein